LRDGKAHEKIDAMRIRPSDEFPNAANHHDAPEQGDVVRFWIVGVGIAVIPALYGVRCLIRGTTTIVGRGGWATIGGSPGVALAISFLAAGAWLHFHFLWENHERLRPYGELGKLLAIFSFAASLMYAGIAFLIVG